MKILLVCVGRLRSKPVRELCGEYLKRLQRYGAAEVLEVRDAQSAEPAAARAEESTRLLAALTPADRVWVLDETGQGHTSRAWAERLTTCENRSVKRLALVMGGAYGLTDQARKRGEVISLGPLTLPHELCRLVVLEQLYRARTIQRGEPYHHD